MTSHSHDAPAEQVAAPPGTPVAPSPSDDGKDARPAPRHEEAVEGFWWPGRRKCGVLLVHEFGASPEGLRHVAAHLVDAGLWVAAPVLPGHDNPRDAARLDGVSAAELLECVATWQESLLAEVPTVILAGCGLGGSLALCTAAAQRTRTSGVATIGTPVHTFTRRRPWHRLMALVTGTSLAPGPDVKRAGSSEPLYDRLPAAAFEVMADLERRGAHALPNVAAPALVFHAREDHVVPRPDASALYVALASTSKELVWLERSFHQAWIDHDAAFIGERLARFAGALAESGVAGLAG